MYLIRLFSIRETMEIKVIREAKVPKERWEIQDLQDQK